MNIEQIVRNREILDKELRRALSSMEKKDTIFEIRKKIKDNQDACPHFSAVLNFVQTDDYCPYCGKKIGRN